MTMEPLDLFGIDALLDEQERDIQGTVRRLVDERLRPRLPEWFESGTPQPEAFQEIARDLGALGLFGMHLQGYGCAGTNAVSYGLARLQLQAGDSGLRSFVSVQGSLSMFSIHRYGSEGQKQEWLPRLATGEALGCFGLTEPDFGSNPAGMRTRARRDGSDWVLDGTKMWITNGSLADVATVWAQTDDGGGGVRGFLVHGHTGIRREQRARETVHAGVGDVGTGARRRPGAGVGAAARGPRAGRAAVVPQRGPVRHRVRFPRRGP